MKHQWIIALCLLVMLGALSSCAAPTAEEPKVFAEVTQNLGPANAATDPPATTPPESAGESAGGQSIFAQNPALALGDTAAFAPEDAMNEEDYGDYGEYEEGGYEDPYGDIYAYADSNATMHPYAGSTPIPLDPVNMPVATPVPMEPFVYVPYTIASLGVTFQGPSGWMPDESQSEVFTLTEFDGQVKDGQPGILKVSASPVTQDYSQSNLKSEVNQRLKDIGTTNFDVWDPSLTATRHLMGANGVYANYSGTLVNGVKVGGRIHCVSLDQVLYTIEVTYPLAYKDAYLEAFNEMRKTMTRN